MVVLSNIMPSWNQPPQTKFAWIAAAAGALESSNEAIGGYFAGQSAATQAAIDALNNNDNGAATERSNIQLILGIGGAVIALALLGFYFSRQ